MSGCEYDTSTPCNECGECMTDIGELPEEPRKTNFDHWRGNLTIEEMVSMSTGVLSLFCTNCPAKKHCRPFCTEEPIAHKCESNFRQWANAPHVEGINENPTDT